MRNKIFPLFLVIFFLLFFFIFCKGLENSNIYTPKNNIKKNIPSFEAKLFDSDNIIVSNEIFKDEKFYLVNIWASWCVPCRDEHPFLIKLSRDKNMKIIGLNYKDKEKNAKNFLDELGNPYEKILLDKDGTIGIELGAYGVPESFLVYKNEIIKKIIGPLNEKSFEEINRIVK